MNFFFNVLLTSQSGFEVFCFCGCEGQGRGYRGGERGGYEASEETTATGVKGRIMLIASVY